MTPSGDDKRPKSPGGSPTKGTSGSGRAKGARGSSQPTPETGAEERGILSSLPSTRPQRPSARRAAVKRAAVKRAAAERSGPDRSVGSAETKPTEPGSRPASPQPNGRRAAAKRAKPAPTRRRTAPPPPPPREPPVPPQGFEGEDEIAPGAPVQPPSRPEVAGALAELVGELAQSGLARGGRLVREALGRLPGV